MPIPRANRKIIAIGAALFFCIALLAGALYAYTAIRTTNHAQESGSFTVDPESVTIMTSSLPTLPPHQHLADATGQDSVLTLGHGKNVHSGKFSVPFDMWITGVQLKTNNAPNAVLHHLILFKDGYPSTECADRDTELYAMGADSPTSNTLPAPYGIFLKKGTVIYLNGMVHNPAFPRGPGGTYEHVSIGFTLQYELPSSSRYRPLEFHRLFLYDNDHCVNPYTSPEAQLDAFTVPARSTHYVKSAAKSPVDNQARFEFPAAGDVITLGAHLHPQDGGIALRMYVNGVLHTTIFPQKTGTGEADWISPLNTNSFRVHQGDVMTIEAVYDNESTFPLMDAMGHGAIFFAPDPASPR